METENNNRKLKAALVNREWFTAAAGILPEEGLGKVVLAAVRFSLDLSEPSGLSDQELTVFRMVKPWLQSDIDAYQAKCERNAAIARNRKPVTSDQTSPVVPNVTNPNSNSNPNPNSNPNLSVESNNEAKRQREWFDIYGYFWVSGSQAPGDETAAFWNYYESLGWKNNKGAAIVSKLAAARMWRRQFGTGKIKAGAVEWYQAVKNCSITDLGLYTAYRGAERTADGVVVHMGVTVRYIKQLMTVIPGICDILARAWNVPAVTIDGLPGVT